MKNIHRCNSPLWSRLILTVFTIVFSLASNAAPIVSGDGTESCDGAECVTIDAHPRWQTNDPLGNGAQWVSSTDSGYGGTTMEFMHTMTVIERFMVSVESFLQLWIWADDTATVSLDNEVLIQPNMTQGICAVGSIGCEPDEYGYVGVDLAPGEHELRLDVYQIGNGTTGNPFGAIYSGSVEATSHSVPEIDGSSVFLVFSLLLSFIAIIRERRS